MFAAIEQALAADGATACFSSNLVLRCLNADRAPQLKRGVMLLLGKRANCYEHDPH